MKGKKLGEDLEKIKKKLNNVLGFVEVDIGYNDEDGLITIGLGDGERRVKVLVEDVSMREAYNILKCAYEIAKREIGLRTEWLEIH